MLLFCSCKMLSPFCTLNLISIWALHVFLVVSQLLFKSIWLCLYQPEWYRSTKLQPTLDLQQRQKKARFWNFIESVNCDIICGCETWLNPTIYDAEVLASNSNYNIHLKNRLDGHGGSLILIKDNIVSEPVKSILHVTFYSRKLNISKETVMIGSAYRPTNNNEEYSKQLFQAISQICNIFKKATIWIAGDFN